MVSFVPQGRLGNFLFTAAATIAYALKHGLKYSMPRATNDQFWNPIYFPHLIFDEEQYASRGIPVDEVEMFRYDELPFQESWRHHPIVLRGYFQNQDYFKEYRAELLKAFNLPWESRKDQVSVHVRRGDYLTLTDKHPPVSVEWYRNAMSKFNGNTKFVFFSDDLQWCRDTFGDRDDCIFHAGKDELDDLVALSCCEHHINSASTFSWWGAWLNQNPDKIVILPRHWFGPKVTTKYTEQIVPKEWVRL